MSNAGEQRVPSRGRLLIPLVAIIIVTFVAQSAFAAPVDDKRKQAQKLAAQIDANGDKISALSESYNAARIQLGSLRSSVTDATSQLAAAEALNKEVKSRVSKRAVTMYTSESDTTVTPSDASDQRKDLYADIATGSDSDTIAQLVVTKETVSERKAALQKQLESVSAQERTLSEQKRSIEAANKAQLSLLKKTKGELASLVAAQRERQAAEAAARAIARSRQSQSNDSSGSGSGGGSNTPFPTNLPSPSSRAAVAIAYARAQLGKPYKWAAAGPNAFDCSGLVMRAWGAAGLSLPHSSSGQYNMFPKVPLYAMQPGDLVYHPGHIGIYIGNGLMIHAPQTGDVVKIASIGRATGASRPG